QLLHGRLVRAVADDLERLNQRDAGCQHGCQLTGEHCDVFGLDLAAAHGGALLANARWRDALASQLDPQRLLVGSEAAPLDAGAALVATFPGKRDVALEGTRGLSCSCL